MGAASGGRKSCPGGAADTARAMRVQRGGPGRFANKAEAKQLRAYRKCLWLNWQGKRPGQHRHTSAAAHLLTRTRRHLDVAERAPQALWGWPWP